MYSLSCLFLHRYGKPGVPVLMIANKWDADTDGSVIEAGQEYAAAKGIPHIVVSAKTGERVSDAFVGAARLVMGREVALEKGTGKGKGPRDIAPGGDDDSATSSSLLSCCKTS